MSIVNVLLELGAEELPAAAVTRFPEQLTQQIQTLLQQASLSFNEVHIYITPRRIAVYITELSAQQPDRTIVRQGPQ